MEQNNSKFDGFLISGDTTIPVQISYGSQFSVFVKIINDPIPVEETDYDRIIINISGVEYEFGSCRLVIEPRIDEYTGTIVFLKDIYDFKTFFFDKKQLILDTLSKNLILVLSQKDRVKEAFKQYTSDLIYELKVYKHFFDSLDSKFSGEPVLVQNAIFDVIVNTESEKFIQFLEKKFKKLEQLISSYSKEDHELHGFYLRKQLWDIIHCSEFMLRTNLKPRGYAGDSEMMRMIYDNAYRGDSTFSKLLNKFGLNVAAAQSVRNRRILIPQILHQVQQEFAEQNQQLLKFMSVACGPAYELSDLFTSINDVKKFHSTLLDQDEDALAEAEENIRLIDQKYGGKVNVTYLQDSVRTMIRTPELYTLWGRFHFIYSMGLFDYLTQPVAKAVIEKIYSLLEPGGRLLIGNYHHNNSSRWFMEYWLDWVLYYRSDEEMIDLLRDTDAEAISVLFEESGCQMFLSAQNL